MISKVYNLPEISFVGGETHDLRFHLFTDTGRVFNASGAKATFSIVYSVNRRHVWGNGYPKPAYFGNH